MTRVPSSAYIIYVHYTIHSNIRWMCMLAESSSWMIYSKDWQVPIILAIFIETLIEDISELQCDRERCWCSSPKGMRGRRSRKTCDGRQESRKMRDGRQEMWDRRFDEGCGATKPPTIKCCIESFFKLTTSRHFCVNDDAGAQLCIHNICTLHNTQ